jgi:hypothetical protein
MNLDRNSLIFVAEYYEILLNNPILIENVYVDGASLLIYEKNSQAKIVS